MVLTIGLLICAYYNATAFACVWYISRELCSPMVLPTSCLLLRFFREGRRTVAEARVTEKRTFPFGPADTHEPPTTRTESPAS
ncbi:hypothetical protein ACFU8W_44545 [Streptomyces sp. NPDC057565]|uniref:hypothetical protein n=1 Tax=Streptomyces sp. NPDC057565 TaxID=3346169 RepID=UPI00369FEBA0